MILKDPSLLPIPSDPNVDPLLYQAAVEGEELAKKWKDQGIRRRFVRERYLAVESGAERPVETLGPFVSEDLILVQFAFYEAIPFFRLVQTEDVGAGTIKRVAALLPKTTVVDPDDPKRWRVYPGTVWISAHDFKEGFDGWVGLRVTGGTLSIDDGTAGPDGVVIPANLSWTLKLAPETPPRRWPAGRTQTASR